MNKLCPICNGKLDCQPTVDDNIRTETCHNFKVNADGKRSSTFKCKYKSILKNGKVIHEEWARVKDSGLSV